MTTEESTGMWVTARYRDGETALSWLKAIGFVEIAVYRSTENPSVIEHAELSWPLGGGVMFGSSPDANEQWPQQPGTAAAYLVTDDPDGLHAAAVDAGGSDLDPVSDNDYGGRGGSVRDPEGNLWSFGSYRPGQTPRQ